MTKWYVLTVLMTAIVLALCLWVTNKAYSRKWEDDEPDKDPFDFDAASQNPDVHERNENA
jgi:hypothetical protein